MAQGSEERFLERWFPPRTRIGLGIALMILVAVLLFDAAKFGWNFVALFSDVNHWDGVLTELHGAVFDVVIFGVVVLWLDEQRGRREVVERKERETEEQVRRWNEELEDFSGWFDDEQSARRTAGLVRRIVRAGGQVFAPGANLEGANLQGANLIGANLQSANLRGALLTNCDLQNADLRGAKLPTPNWSNWYNVNLNGVRRYERDGEVPGWKLTNVSGTGDEPFEPWGVLARDETYRPAL